MNKEKRHSIYYYINTLIYVKFQFKYNILKSIKFNRNIKNKKHIIFYFFLQQKKSSISKLKSVCLQTGYKRAIINKLGSSRYISNKIAKLGQIHNYKPF